MPKWRCDIASCKWNERMCMCMCRLKDHLSGDRHEKIWWFEWSLSCCTSPKQKWVRSRLEERRGDFRSNVCYLCTVTKTRTTNRYYPKYSVHHLMASLLTSRVRRHQHVRVGAGASFDGVLAQHQSMSHRAAVVRSVHESLHCPQIDQRTKRRWLTSWWRWRWRWWRLLSVLVCKTLLFWNQIFLWKIFFSSVIHYTRTNNPIASPAHLVFAI